jgi:hypothetical protein
MMLVKCGLVTCQSKHGIIHLSANCTIVINFCDSIRTFDSTLNLEAEGGITSTSATSSPSVVKAVCTSVIKDAVEELIAVGHEGNMVMKDTGDKCIMWLLCVFAKRYTVARGCIATDLCCIDC